MAVQIVFQNNLNPAVENLSSRFVGATAFYIAAPFLSVEYQIDVFLQVYFPAITGEQVRAIPLGQIEEQAILLNVTDTERVQTIPSEFVDTGLEMALLFLSSDSTFIQAAIIKPSCSLTDVCSSLDAVNARLTTIESAITNITVPATVSTPTELQQQFFYLQ